MTQNGQSDIDYILGLRHAGSIKSWGLLPSSFNFFKTYMREYCKNHGGNPKDATLFVYAPSIAKTINVLNGGDWQKQHLANQTGTIDAYLPKGHAFSNGKRDTATGDYEPWSPE